MGGFLLKKFKISSEKNPNDKITKNGLGRAKQFSWDMDSPCLGLMFLKFGEISNSARRRGLGRNAGNSKYKFKIVPSYIISLCPV